MYLVILIYLMNLLEDWFLYFWDNIFHTYNNHIDINQLIFMRNNSICFYMIDDIEDTFFPVLLLLLLLLLIYLTLTIKTYKSCISLKTPTFNKHVN